MWMSMKYVEITPDGAEPSAFTVLRVMYFQRYIGIDDVSYVSA